MLLLFFGDRTLGTREFSFVVCGFGQVFIVIPTQKASGQCFDSTETIASTAKVQILDMMADWFINPPKGL